jgi:uncharacterized protein YjbJ (UPF0337 family)
MNSEQFSGQWKIVKGKVKEKWGKLTDDDINQIDGKREQLLGFLQKRYGYEKERATQELENWEKEIETEHVAKPKR